MFTKKIQPKILVLLAFLPMISLAQSNNDLYKYIPKYDVPKSPNVSSFERYTSIPGNFATGQTNPSIPLMSFNVDGVTVPLSLTYSNTGLKVSDVASWVGLGWNLNVGGLITRTVKGLPDDADLGILNNSYMSNNLYRITHGQMTGLERWNYFRTIAQNLADVEHDIFHYDVLSLKGSFYINSQGQCVQLPGSNNKIQFTKDANNRLNTFTITDEEGNNYFFNLKEESTITSIASPVTGNTNNYFTRLTGDTWHLTEIRTKNNEEIYFTYNHYHYSKIEKTESQTFISISTTGIQCSEAQDAAPSTWTPGSINQTLITTLVDVYQPSQISWKNGFINLTSQTNRGDIQQIDANATVPCLDGLALYETPTAFSQGNVRLLQTISFQYLQSPRLFLKKITFSNPAGAQDHNYQFFYYNEASGTWPSYSPYQNSYNAQDYWGYYNGAIYNPGLIPYDAISAYPAIDGINAYYGINKTGYAGINNRIPNPTYSTYGMLQQINYPTGGRTVFTYEGNMVKKQSVPTYTNESPTLVNTLTQTTDAQSNILVTLGGIRVKKYDFYDDPASPIASVTTNINYDPTAFSIGFIPFFYTYLDREFLPPPEAPQSCQPCGNKYLFSLSSSNIASDPAPVIQYKTVTEFNGTSNSAGQILHSFFPSDYGQGLYFQEPYPSPFFFSWHGKEIKTSYQSPNGSNISIKSSSDLNNEVSPSLQSDRLNQFDYDFKLMLVRNDNCQGAIGCSQYTTNVNPCTDADADNVVGQIFKWTNVEITTENYVNQQTQNTTYSNDGQSVQDVINLNYNLNQKNLLLPNSTSKVNSKGETLQTVISYPQDYFSGVANTTSDPVVNGLVNLINSNIVGVPIETINTINSGGNTYVTGGTLLMFNSNQPTVSNLYKLSLTTRILLSSFVKSYINSSGTFVFDQHYELAGQFYYNANGQIVEYLERAGGPHHSILWDYNSTDQIAQVVNASQSDIAYTSFEADGTGNWTIPSSTRNSTGASGLHSYNLLNGSLSKAGLSASNTYTISYWTQNSTPYTIAGTISGYPIKGVTNNGWTYYEHHVTGQTTITVSGSGNLDDVRFYPSNAQMTTYTYDPLIGMTSSTDAKGEVTYYEYDSFQRLQNIKDKDGNIIKSYVYHYQGQ